MKNKAAGGRQQAAGSRSESSRSEVSCALPQGTVRRGRLPRASRLFPPATCCLLPAACCLLPFLCCLLPAAFAQPPPSPPAANATTAPPGPPTYDNFKLIHTRNVFDPDRRPVRAAAVTPAGRADYIALTGTLLHAEKSYAFFSGSRADFNKVLSVGDKIANATLAQITPAAVVVEREGRRTTVPVGQTVPLDAKSAPGPAPTNAVEITATSLDRPTAPTTRGGSDAPPPTGAAANAAPPPAGAPAAKGPGPSKEEIARRMMERRQQDLK